MSLSSGGSRHQKTTRKIVIGVVITVVGGLILTGILNLGSWLGQRPPTSSSPPTEIAGNPQDPSGTSSLPTPSETNQGLDVQITLHSLANSDLEVGLTYQTSGKLVPAVPGAPVQIEADGVVLTSVVPDGTGEFDASFSFPEPGRQVELIARLQAGAGNQEATATAGKYDIYEWMHLSDMKPLSNSGNFGSDRQQDLKGQQYDHSLVFSWSARSFGGWDSGDATYNIAAKCIKFTAMVGPDDNSEGDDVEWSFTVSAAGKNITSGYVGIFKPKTIELDLTDAPRLKIEASRKRGVNEDSGDNYKKYMGDGVVAQPKVLCLP